MFRTHKIMRLFNRNIRNVIIGILVITFIIGFIQIFNSMAKEKNETVQNVVTQNIVSNNKQSYSVMTQENVGSATTTENINLIDEFVNYCNNGNIEQAYSLISKECKNIYYNDINGFKEYYYDIVFKTPKIVDMQAWATYKDAVTYKVEYLEDILSSGTYTPDSSIEDYITIIRDEKGTRSININGFINKTSVDTLISKNDIDINCIEKEVYTEYEIYKFNIRNNTDKTIKLDSGESNKTVYLLDENEVKYTGFMYELSEYDLVIEPNKERELKIKFNKFYNPDKEIEEIVFEDLILDYDIYQNTVQPEKHYKNRILVNIGIK